jgi:hypothetical protein
LLGFWEILLVLTVLAFIFLPDFLKRRGNLLTRLRLYLVIIALLLIILILTRVVFTLIGKVLALGMLLILLLLFIAARYLKTSPLVSLG